MQNTLTNLFIPRQFADTHDDYGTRGYIDEFGKPRCMGSKPSKEYTLVDNTPIVNCHQIGQATMRWVGSTLALYNYIKFEGNRPNQQKPQILNIKLTNFFAILPFITIINGAIQEELIEGYNQGETYFVPKDSDFHKKSIAYTESRFAAVVKEGGQKVNKFGLNNLIPGHAYRKRNGETELYMGKRQIWLCEAKTVHADEYRREKDGLEKEGWCVCPFNFYTDDSKLTAWHYKQKTVHLYQTVYHDDVLDASFVEKHRTLYYFTSARSYCEDLGEIVDVATAEKAREYSDLWITNAEKAMDWNMNPEELPVSWQNPITSFQLADFAVEDARVLFEKYNAKDEAYRKVDWNKVLLFSGTSEYRKLSTCAVQFDFKTYDDLLKFLEKPTESVEVYVRIGWGNKLVVMSFAEIIQKYQIKKCRCYRMDGSYARTVLTSGHEIVKEINQN